MDVIAEKVVQDVMMKQEVIKRKIMVPHLLTLGGRRIDYQEKMLNQVDLLHRMFKRGAIIADQFEKRKEALVTQ